ncbi:MULTISPECIES: hypothetical protein [Achromobacter]|uniref:hypothetical protein n=1 Tax=Achromobacter TaxID=222 RepID=UPI002449E156|nr:hypothetical protein [Achromobacter animicus]MDH0685557.1 hypothetical protein [Achromobacter animicus]
MQFAHCFRTFFLAIFLLPHTVTAQQKTSLPPLPPVLSPLESSLPQIVEENLQRNTWFTADGADWGITSQDGDYVETYLSPLACQRWLQVGKAVQPRTLHINGMAVDKAACRSGINKAQYMAPPFDARDVEERLFNKPLSERGRP